MRYFKSPESQIFGIDAGQETLIKPNWVEITKEEAAKPPVLTPEEKRQARINELKVLLASSDYKVLPDYDKPDDGIRQQRQAWRNELRQLGA